MGELGCSDSIKMITLGIKEFEDGSYKVGWVVGEKFLWWCIKKNKRDAMEVLLQTFEETGRKYIPWLEV